MVFEIWFYENQEKTRNKANFENHERTMKNHEVPENHQKNEMSEEYKLSANGVLSTLLSAIEAHVSTVLSSTSSFHDV